MQKIVKPVRSLTGEMMVPGDKSVSHRALMIGSLAKGKTTIKGLSPGQDVRSTLTCLKQLGVHVEENKNEICLQGKGLFSFSQPSETLDAGNSGSTIRMLSGILAGQSFSSVITGDHSLRKRDMKRIIEPLALMGGKIISENGCAPLQIAGGKLHGITYKMPVASAQVKSCLLLAGLHASGETTIIEPSPTRDHTERMLQYFGVPVKCEGHALTVHGKTQPIAREITVPGDFSSAAFFIAAALLVPNSEVIIRNVGVNPTRAHFLKTLQAMGASIDVKSKQEMNGEPVADLYVKSSQLTGIEIGGNDIPLLIDELPVLAVLASQAQGATVIKDAVELRAKESDRIKAVATNLKQMGVSVEELADGMIIRGPGPLKGARLSGFHDHRIVMAFAVGGLAAEGETILEDAEWADISFPGFFETLEKLGTGPIFKRSEVNE